MPCGRVGRRGVETSWLGVPRVHPSGKDVRRRGPAKRLAPAASGARGEVAQEGQASPTRVEVAQESRDEEMTEVFVKSSRMEGKPRMGQSREDLTEWKTVTQDHWCRLR